MKKTLSERPNKKGSRIVWQVAGTVDRHVKRNAKGTEYLLILRPTRFKRKFFWVQRHAAVDENKGIGNPDSLKEVLVQGERNHRKQL